MLLCLVNCSVVVPPLGGGEYATCGKHDQWIRWVYMPALQVAQHFAPRGGGVVRDWWCRCVCKVSSIQVGGSTTAGRGNEIYGEHDECLV